MGRGRTLVWIAKVGAECARRKGVFRLSGRCGAGAACLSHINHSAVSNLLPLPHFLSFAGGCRPPRNLCFLMSSSSDSPTSTPLLKRVDRVFDTTTRVWGCEDTKVESFPSVLSGGRATDGYDVWHSVHFVVVRHMPADSSSKEEPTVTIIIKSSQLREASKNVIGELPGLSWTVDPLEVRAVCSLRILTHKKLPAPCQPIDRVVHSLRAVRPRTRE